MLTRLTGHASARDQTIQSPDSDRHARGRISNSGGLLNVQLKQQILALTLQRRPPAVVATVPRGIDGAACRRGPRLASKLPLNLIEAP